MAAELIGRCRCAFCGSDKAKLTLAKSGLPVLTCNGCNSQSFARSDRSDDLFRKLLIADAVRAVVEPDATPPPPLERKPVAAAAAELADAAPLKKPGVAWGMLR